MKAKSWKFILAGYTTLREQNFVTRVLFEWASTLNLPNGNKSAVYVAIEHLSERETA
jgi:hypothetical protein